MKIWIVSKNGYNSWQVKCIRTSSIWHLAW